MAIIKNYAIWNNKGGVGKSTITYHIATRYAETHPDETILVIDACPQANISMMLLGGSNGEKEVLSLVGQSPSKTIAGYLGETLAATAGQPLPDSKSFVSQVSTFNKEMPDNLYLLCGDGSLELMAPLLQYMSNQPISSATQRSPWMKVRTMLRDFIHHFDEASDDKDLAVFIDTNPSFSIYTEMAISAADRLICPINADDSSRVSATAMVSLLYGSTPPHPLYSQYTYAAKAVAYGLSVPRIHIIVGNRLTQYDGAAKAFAAMSDAASETFYRIFKNHQSYFTNRPLSIYDKDMFKDQFTQLLRDFNSCGVTTTHLGKLLSQMKQGNYQVHTETILIKRERVAECLSAIDDLLSKL